MATKGRVVIFMDGGIIQDVCSDLAIDVVLVDMDTEGLFTEDEIVVIEDIDDAAYIASLSVSPLKTVSKDTLAAITKVLS